MQSNFQSLHAGESLTGRLVRFSLLLVLVLCAAHIICVGVSRYIEYRVGMFGHLLPAILTYPRQTSSLGNAMVAYLLRNFQIAGLLA